MLQLLDTQWYLTDWDKHPTINDECEIKTRNEFILEIEGELKKNNEKTISAYHLFVFDGVAGSHGVRARADKTGQA